MKYPKPLQQGSTVAITAFSSGIAKKHDARFRVVRENLESRGFNVIVGKCLETLSRFCPEVSCTVFEGYCFLGVPASAYS